MQSVIYLFDDQKAPLRPGKKSCEYCQEAQRTIRHTACVHCWALVVIAPMFFAVQHGIRSELTHWLCIYFADILFWKLAGVEGERSFDILFFVCWQCCQHACDISCVRLQAFR